MGYFKDFFSCPNCGGAISGEKKRYFTCPSCGNVLCQEKDLSDFIANYCGHCGQELASAKEEALASVNGSIVTLGPGNYIPMQQ